MDKFAVENVRRMQEAALMQVKARLQDLRLVHVKTAADADEISRLERQQADLEQALKDTATQ